MTGNVRLVSMKLWPGSNQTQFGRQFLSASFLATKCRPSCLRCRKFVELTARRAKQTHKLNQLHGGDQFNVAFWCSANGRIRVVQSREKFAKSTRSEGGGSATAALRWHRTRTGEQQSKWSLRAGEATKRRSRDRQRLHCHCMGDAPRQLRTGRQTHYRIVTLWMSSRCSRSIAKLLVNSSFEASK
jgi:hypothetical protein